MYKMFWACAINGAIVTIMELEEFRVCYSSYGEVHKRLKKIETQ